MLFPGWLLPGEVLCNSLGGSALLIDMGLSSDAFLPFRGKSRSSQVMVVRRNVWGQARDGCSLGDMKSMRSRGHSGVSGVVSPLMMSKTWPDRSTPLQRDFRTRQWHK